MQLHISPGRLCDIFALLLFSKTKARILFAHHHLHDNWFHNLGLRDSAFIKFCYFKLLTISQHPDLWVTYYDLLEHHYDLVDEVPYIKYERKLFIVYSNRGSIIDLEIMHNQLRSAEIKLVLCSFGIPLILAIWPAVLQGATSEQTTNNFCYLYTNNEQSKGVKIQVDIAKIVSWEAPIIFYLSYSLAVLYKIKKFYEDVDEDIFKEIKKLVKRLLAFPIIAICCTMLFTIMDFETFFNVQIGEIQSTISWALLSLWGFLNFFAYLSSSSVQEELFKKEDLEQELNPMVQTEETIAVEDYFYESSQLN